VLSVRELAGAVGGTRRLRSPLWDDLGHRLARDAPATFLPRALVGIQPAADRAGQRDPRRGRAPPQADFSREKDALAVVVGRGNSGPRPVLARLPPQVRHRTHLPLREALPRLDEAVTCDAATSRPLELDRRRRTHRAPARARTCCGPAAPLGTTARSLAPHPISSPERVSVTSCNARLTGQSTEIPETGTGPAERDPKTPENPLSGGEKGSGPDAVLLDIRAFPACQAPTSAGSYDDRATFPSSCSRP